MDGNSKRFKEEYTDLSGCVVVEGEDEEEIIEEEVVEEEEVEEEEESVTPPEPERLQRKQTPYPREAASGETSEEEESLECQEEEAPPQPSSDPSVFNIFEYFNHLKAQGIKFQTECKSNMLIFGYEHQQNHAVFEQLGSDFKILSDITLDVSGDSSFFGTWSYPNDAHSKIELNYIKPDQETEKFLTEKMSNIPPPPPGFFPPLPPGEPPRKATPMPGTEAQLLTPMFAARANWGEGQAGTLNTNRGNEEKVVVPKFYYT